MSANTLDPTGWSTQRIDSAIIRRQNAARELATRDGNDAEIQRLNAELNQLLDARNHPGSPRDIPAADVPQTETSYLVVEGIQYPIPEKLTLGEIADLEEVMGGEIGDKSKMRMNLGMAWIALRRKDPTWTIERVRDLDMDALDEGSDASPPDGNAAA